MTETTILSLVAGTGWYAIYDNGDGTVFSSPAVAFAAIRDTYEDGPADSVVPVVMRDGYWIPTEESNLLAVCHESELEAAMVEWTAYVRGRAERSQQADS